MRELIKYQYTKEVYARAMTKGEYYTYKKIQEGMKENLNARGFLVICNNDTGDYSEQWVPEAIFNVGHKEVSL